MTSYLVLYMTQGARLFGQGENARGLRLSRFGVLPHEIAALNARHQPVARPEPAAQAGQPESALGAMRPLADCAC
jgi:hypothetical protein